MTAEELLRANHIGLSDTRPGHYDAICPQCSHKRTKPNQNVRCLGVKIDEQGACWRCNHCGWSGPSKSNGNGHAQGDDPFIATYDYLDADGTTLFQVCRTANKQFPQRKPNGNGGWTWGTAGVHKVLYRLPEVREAIANEHTVCVVEGEKDCDALWSIGVPATCSPGGAAQPGQQAKWRTEYSEMLRDADVIVLPDNDAPGRAHAEATATMLLGIAKRVRVLDLSDHWPAMPQHGDVSDWLAALHTREELDTLIEHAPEYSSRWPRMDAAAYHGLAGDFVKALAPHTEADLVGILIQFLVALGNVIGNSPYYLVEADKHHCNLFAILVGNSSKGRKGTGGGRVRAITKLADETWFDNRTASGLSTGEGLIEHVRDEVVKWNPKEQRNETTDQGVKDKRLMVMEAEFASPLAVMERPGNTLSQVVRAAWDGLKLQTMTRASPLKATGAHISIVAHITKDELRSRLTRIYMANGFANRFLFCVTRRSKFLPHGGHLDDQALVELAERLRKAIEFARLRDRVTMTDEAAAKWTAAYPELSADRPGLMGAVTARAEAQVIRLALLYALLDSKGEIGTDHLSAAMAVWAYCDHSANLIFGDSLGDPVADDIFVGLQRNSAGMTRTDISNLFGRHRTSEQISVALSMLLQLGRAKVETKQTAGRPVETWLAIGGSR